RRQQAAGVVEVQVAEHHRVHVLVLETGRAQRFHQHVAVFLHAVTLAQLRLEERADAGLEQHRLAVQRAGQQRAAGQVDAIVLVGAGPLLPHRLRRVAEHGAAVEFLRIAADGPEFHERMLALHPLRIRNSAAPAQGTASAARTRRTSALPTGLRGSVPPCSALPRRSHITVCRLPQKWLEAPLETSPSGRSRVWPMARRRAATSGLKAPVSASTTSGCHWWW